MGPLTPAPVPSCGFCIWKYVNRLWVRESQCTPGSNCRCPDTIQDDKDSNGVQVTLQNSGTLVDGSPTGEKGFDNDRFKKVLKKMVKKNIALEHRKFTNESDRSTPSLAQPTAVASEAQVNSLFQDDDVLSTFTVPCVPPRNTPGDPLNGQHVIG